MTYQALARKWRPQDFSSLIGQEPVVTALRNALTEGRIAQAYLFAGIRGVGKTTAARVLAKALNCERGPAGDPCNDCRACSEITSGADLDVLEVDAATYSKVEQIRELTESLRYGPAHNRYKVVVLDEVHRLSRQAFDALLKIVEEPPAHLVFIFATTEIEAVPATVLSRCQEFHFRRVPGPILAAHLEKLAKAESIEVSSSALRLVARAGDGSVRDAVALLDQLATYGSGRIDDQDAARLLAGFDPALFFHLLGSTLQGDGASLQAAIREIESEGRDPRQIYSGLLAYCRDALHLSTGTPVDRLDLPTEEAQRLSGLVAKSSYEDLLRVTHHLLQSESLVRRSEASGLALEIALLRAAELPKVTGVEALFGRQPPNREPTAGLAPAPPLLSEPPPAGAATPAVDEFQDGTPTTADPLSQTPVAAEPVAIEPLEAPPTTPPTPEPPDSEVPAGQDSGPPPSDPPSPTETAEGRDAQAASEEPIARLLARVRRDRQVLAAHLSQAQQLELQGRHLLILQDPDDDWLGPALERGGNRATLELALSEIVGDGASWEVRDGATSHQTQDSASEEPVDGDRPEDNPTVQAVLQIFDGSIDNSSSDP